MATARKAVRALLSMGVPSPGWYAVLTGCALLLVGYALGSVSTDIVEDTELRTPGGRP